MSVNVPRLLLCAPKSGAGKTTITCAILQALVNRSCAPVAFKCGPDYIDPMFHSEIIGAKSRNIDLFLMGRETAKRLFIQNSRSGGVSIIEGVMGYYDGIGMSAEASAWDVATELEAPAVLIVDGRGRALSVAAEVRGFAQFRADSRILGVIINRVSPMMYPRMKQCIEDETDIKVYGYLPSLPDCAVESRHLGLVMASEISDLKEKLSVLAEKAEACIDIDGLLTLANSAPALEEPAQVNLPVVEGHPVIAVARDKAFSFYYSDALNLLEELGAKLAYFSPLADSGLPEGASAMYLGGGYPEVYAKELSQNRAMCQSVKNAVEKGMPTIAECGGFLYLHAELGDESDNYYPMAGVFPARAYRTSKLSRFGYVNLTAENSGLPGDVGRSFPAHEFHYWNSEMPGDSFTAEKPKSDNSWKCVHMTNSMYAGFPHIHLCAEPEVAVRFVSAAVAFRESRL